MLGVADPFMLGVADPFMLATKWLGLRGWTHCRIEARDFVFLWRFTLSFCGNFARKLFLLSWSLRFER